MVMACVIVFLYCLGGTPGQLDIDKEALVPTRRVSSLHGFRETNVTIPRAQTTVGYTRWADHDSSVDALEAEQSRHLHSSVEVEQNRPLRYDQGPGRGDGRNDNRVDGGLIGPISDDRPEETPGENDKELKWVQLVPGSHIQHANITLPLDYKDPSVGTVSVALTRMKATSSLPRLGSLLINPGGPGGSGTAFSYQAGNLLMNTTGGRYDIIGFDPRGVNLTMQFNCYDSMEQRYMTSVQQPPLAHANDEAIGEIVAWKKLQGEMCSTNELGKYISTAFVATDMLHISRALGDDKLNYYGFSYGSVLGNTFAQLYPESVGRMIIDGVVDAEDYYQGLWLKNLVNADDVASVFYNMCAESRNCALNGTVDEVRATVNGLFARLKHEPLTVSRGKNRGLLNYSLMKQAFFAALYSPRRWKLLSEQIRDILVYSDGKSLFDVMWEFAHEATDEGGYATRCGDSSRSELLPRLSSVEAMTDFLKQMEMLSRDFAEAWLYMPCYGYTQTPKMLWDGPFKTVNASALIIGNTFDPVTPLLAAKKMAQYYTNGAVLQHNGFGHASLDHQSACTRAAIRKWLEHGILPSQGTVCNTDYLNPFDGPSV